VKEIISRLFSKIVFKKNGGKTTLKFCWTQWKCFMKIQDQHIFIGQKYIFLH